MKKDGFEAVLALTEFGNKKSWLLSGWKTNKPDAIGEVSTQSDAMQFKPTFSRQELGADLLNIIHEKHNNSKKESVAHGSRIYSLELDEIRKTAST